MLVTREARIKGLLHEDFFVRSAVLGSFEGGVEARTDVTKAAIEAIARYGWDDAFEWPHKIARLSQDEDTIEWLFGQLAERSHRGPKTMMRLHLAKWFSQAPVDLIRPNLRRLETAFEGRPAAHGNLRLAVRLQAAQERVQFDSETDDQCLVCLENVFAQCRKAQGFPHALLGRAERLAERLAVNGDRTRIVKLTLRWLASASEGQTAQWRAGVGIRLAGLLRHRDATPRLLEMFEADWDWWNEEIESALTAMHDEAVLTHIITAFPRLLAHARLYTSGVFVNARIRGVEGQLPRLLETETDDLIRINIGHALALYGTSSSMTTARRVYDEYEGDPEAFQIAETLYAFYHLLGEVHRPELSIWRRKLDALCAKHKAMEAALN